MNKDRIVGVAKEISGSIKEGIGEILNNARLMAEGRSDKAEGKAQRSAGRLKDAPRK